MPALEAGSKFSNIMKSHDLFVKAQIETGLSQTVFYMYQPIPSAISLPTRWIVSTLINLGQSGLMQIAGADRHSAIVDFLSVFNIYEKVSINTTETNRYSLAALASNVAGAFPMGLSIPIYDYDTVGNPQDGGLSIRGFPSISIDASLELEGVRQMNVSVPLWMNAVTII